MVERRRKQGARVTKTAETHAVIGFLDVREDIQSKGRTYSYKVRRKRRLKVGKATAFWPAVELGTPLRALPAAHCGFDKPEVLEERYINLEAAPEALEADFEVDIPDTWLLARPPCTRLRHTIRAEAATAAEVLGVPEGVKRLWNGPLDRRAKGTPGMIGERGRSLFLKRQLSLPVSMMSQ